jgi:hypothetical protein
MAEMAENSCSYHKTILSEFSDALISSCCVFHCLWRCIRGFYWSFNLFVRCDWTANVGRVHDAAQF